MVRVPWGNAVKAAALGLALLGALASAGCTPPTQAKTILTYSEDAKRAYDEAMEDFKGHNWLEAQALFREVKRKYVYSRYAKLAQLRIADADFEQEKFGEATRGYRLFIREHRTDSEEIAYARSKIAEAQYKEIGEAFLLPSADEREQSSIREAYIELRGFLRDYPDAKEVPHIRELLGDVIARLMRHEVLVAKFYLQRDNYEAAASRVKFAIKTYGTGDDPLDVATSTEAEAWLFLGELYLRMHKWEDARASFEQILRQFRTSERRTQARNYLDKLKVEHPQGSDAAKDGAPRDPAVKLQPSVLAQP
jgi:outer membrane protein assembly factor BamD